MQRRELQKKSMTGEKWQSAHGNRKIAKKECQRMAKNGKEWQRMAKVRKELQIIAQNCTELQ
jgi:hypothetical protein